MERNSRKVKIGKVISNKMDKTIVVAIEYSVKHPLYGKVVKKTYKLKAHDEENICAKGDKVKVTEQKTVNGQPWGKTERGWICLSYVKVESGSVKETFTGVVNADGLRIRDAAGAKGKIVAYYAKGDQVEILETTMVDGQKWGRTKHGWISLEFVNKK